jgi:hypothetical protein
VPGLGKNGRNGKRYKKAVREEKNGEIQKVATSEKKRRNKVLEAEGEEGNILKKSKVADVDMECLMVANAKVDAGLSEQLREFQ